MDEETRARHRDNLAGLLAARDAMMAKWEAEDVVLKAERAAMLEKFAAGLRHFEEITGLRAVAPAEPPAADAPAAPAEDATG